MNSKNSKFKNSLNKYAIQCNWITSLNGIEKNIFLWIIFVRFKVFKIINYPL